MMVVLEPALQIRMCVRRSDLKELKMRPSTDEHDYQVRLRSAIKFLIKVRWAPCAWSWICRYFCGACYAAGLSQGPSTVLACASLCLIFLTLTSQGGVTSTTFQHGSACTAAWQCGTVRGASLAAGRQGEADVPVPRPGARVPGHRARHVRGG